MNRSKEVEKAMGPGCADYYCNKCGCHQVLVAYILKLEVDLAHEEAKRMQAQADVASLKEELRDIGAVNTRLLTKSQGAENRVDYLERIIAEAAGKAGVPR